MNDQIMRRATVAEFQLREADGGKVGLRGYAALFGVEAHREVILEGAFDKSLQERDDVRLLVNHDGVPLARSKSGTLKLSVDQKGLVAEVDNLDTSNPTVAELVSAMGRGDIDQMSFAFTTVRQNVVYDDDGYFQLRELAEVKLWDVSVVTYPWYEETSVDLKELDRALVALRSGAPLTEKQRELIRARALPADHPTERDDEKNDDERADAPSHALRAQRLALLARQYAA